ncbi:MULTISPECIES: hypothetical protein [Aquitalea]|uniref:hypothetical protein n=1 Tax=Aquitalea TaxID=407217 RepID=UPI000F59AA4A|nr:MULTISPECIES: hypothetical protein [Aquitalea]
MKETTAPMPPMGPIKHADRWPGRGLKRLPCLSDLTLANREFRRASLRSVSGGQPQAMLAGVAWEVKEGLARQSLLPGRRAEAAPKTITRAADLYPPASSNQQQATTLPHVATIRPRVGF